MFCCSNCGEMLEEDATKCYFCNRMITESEKKAILSRLKMENEIGETIREHRKRTIRGLILIPIFILIFIAVLAVLFMMEVNSLVTLGIGIGVGVMECIVLALTGFGRCPHCGLFLARRVFLFDSHCSCCGVRIR